MSIEAQQNVVSPLAAMKQALYLLEEFVDDPRCQKQIDDASIALRTAIEAAEKQEPVALEIIRKWPEGFQERLQHVWLDVVSFIPNVKLYDLQRVLAEFGFTMKLYEGEAPAVKREWVGLTDDSVYAAAEVAWRAGWAACRDAEFVGEEAEDEAWGYQGATVAQDIEAKLREKNGGNT